MRDRLAAFLARHPELGAFAHKLEKDNVGFLASAVAWSLLTSMVPVVVALIAIGGLFMRSPGLHQSLVDHLSGALQGAIDRNEIDGIVRGATRHIGLLSLLGFVGLVWGGSNLGGAISTVFQPIFQVRGRPWVREKLIDIGMILVFTVLLLVVVVATSVAAFINALFVHLPLPGVAQFVLGTTIGLLAAFVLFSLIYVVFPNTEPRFKLENVWPAAGIVAVLFEGLTFIFPIYVKTSHFQRYGAVVFSILVLTAWIYFLSILLVMGAELVAVGALHDARRHHQPIGPAPDGTVPQREDTDTEGSAVAS